MRFQSRWISMGGVTDLSFLERIQYDSQTLGFSSDGSKHENIHLNFKYTSQNTVLYVW